MGIAALATGIVLGRILPNGNTTMLVATLAYTLIYCGLGGYVTAVIDKDRPLLAAAILAVLIALMTFLNLLMMPNSAPLWWKVLGGALSGPFAYLGGWARAHP